MAVEKMRVSGPEFSPDLGVFAHWACTMLAGAGLLMCGQLAIIDSI